MVMSKAMSSKQSRLESLGPVCCDNSKDRTHSRTPTPMLFSDIPLLWTILDLVVQDWKREVTPLQAAIDNATNENEKRLRALQAFSNLQPYYLKCLFSFVMFFIALERAYKQFHKELDLLNRKPFFRFAHDREPTPTAYIEKVKKIRNISIEHILSTRYKITAINSAAAMMWQPMTLAACRRSQGLQTETLLM